MRALAPVLALLLLPSAVPALGLTQDDAGSGRDAPDNLATPLPVAPDVVHRAQLGGLGDSDVYAFEGRAGDVVYVSFLAETACVEIVDEAGVVADGASDGWLIYCATAYADSGYHLARLQHDGTWRIHVHRRFAGEPPQDYLFSYALNHPAPPASPVPLLPAGEPLPCAATADTSGAGDPAIPTLRWLAVKTGFRAAVSWTSDLPELGALTYDAGEGARTLREETPRRVHLFVLERLPIGGLLCFQASSGLATGAVHGLRLANAMNDPDPVSGTYRLNLLVYVGGLVATRAALDDAFGRFATRVWDMTDGRVRVASVLVVFDEAEHAAVEPWPRCPTLAAHHPTTLRCREAYDVVVHPRGSASAIASTYRDAIVDPENPISYEVAWAYKDVGDLFGGYDFGHILAHETGHYAFGALDLYAAESDCWDPAWELSVMGLDLRASELDDETHRCPNEDDIPGYVPSWTLLRQRYPLVHDRSEPDAGPAGDGGAFSLTVWRLLDLEPVFEDDFEDDAGSGRDAGESRADAVDVAPGVVHRGTIVDTASDTDFYRIAVPGPGTLRVRLGSATVACVYLDGEDETACADGASLFYIEEEIERAFAAAGEAYLVVDGGFVSHYSFSFAWDAEPPPPFPSVAFPP